MFHKILIANRGEIACRIIKTARRLGILTVAIYSEADQKSPHVLLADEAYCVGPAIAKDSYLNIEAIIKIAELSGVEAIHPGYGFLSENSDFVKACNDAHIIFIGPSIKAMEIMGSKQLSKQLLEKTNVPLTPGYHGKNQSAEELLKQAKIIGFPALLKAAHGGGGKGMRTVFKEEAFQEALFGARREAMAYFANDTMLIEKLIENPRHIELQIMADNHGNVVHLFERDCSIQRRHQKIIEEAPAINLSPSLREKLAQAAITVAKEIDYRGAGTIEFLVSDDQFYFMEMNTRLQVEHPVTEMITGFDLVEWQLLIANNQPLPALQNQIQQQGHAIECRIYAEDPDHDFLPSIGEIHFLKEPTGFGIRIDSGVTQHFAITRYYDPMVAKLIVHGDNRMQALQRMQYALSHYHIGGIKTNLPFLQAVVQHPDFIHETYSTAFLNQKSITTSKPNKHLAAMRAACFNYMKAQTHLGALEKDTFAWQMLGQSQWQATYVVDGESIDVTSIAKNHHEVALKIKDETYFFQIALFGDTLHLDNGKQHTQVIVEERNGGLIFYTELGPILVQPFSWHNEAKHTHEHQLTSPMPATIVAILKKVGDRIKMGDGLIVLEAMKMEHTIYAPHHGTLTDIFYELGAQVPEGAELVALQNETKSV